MRKALFILLLLLGAIPVQAASTRYIALGGTDTGGCTSIGSPCATTAYVAPLMAPGDTTYMRGGDYSASQSIQLDDTPSHCPTCQSGTSWASSGVITWAAYPGETVTVNFVWAARNFMIFDGINVNGVTFFDAGLKITGYHVEFKNFVIENAYYDGISSESFGAGVSNDLRVHDGRISYAGTRDVRVRCTDNGDVQPCKVPHHGWYFDGGDNNVTYNLDFDHMDPDGYCIQYYSGHDWAPSHNVFRNNTCHNSDGAGLFTGNAASSNLIYNNLFYALGGHALDMALGTANQALNNTIYAATGTGIQITGNSAVITGNIVYGTVGGADIVVFSGATSTVLTKNQTGSAITDSGTSTTLTGNVTGNPNFVSTSSPYNFHVSGTPPVSSGSNLSAQFTLDYAYGNRPSGSTAWTIGAYEENAAACTPAKLGWINQPSNANTGVSIGMLGVAVQDSGGVTCGSATNTVTIAKTGGTCTGMTLNGTVSGAAAAGVFATSNVNLTVAGGSCSLTATASGLTSAVSSAFTITSCTPAKLMFTSSPTNANPGQYLTTVIVAVLDTSNILCSTDTRTITLAKNASATWGTLTSADGLAQAAVGGTATWIDLTIDSFGAGSIDATATGATSATSDSFSIAEIEVLLNAFTVNAVQASIVSGSHIRMRR